MPQAPSTRWCPTPEQLMILEEMYRSGIRTPNASQIQQITAHLSYYGKIEGKNVFYWFQNHKARDRQKLRRRLSRHHQLLHLHPAAATAAGSGQAHSVPAGHQQFHDFVEESSTSPLPSPTSLSYQNPFDQIFHQGGSNQDGNPEMNLLSKLDTSGQERLDQGAAASSSRTSYLMHEWMAPQPVMPAVAIRSSSVFPAPCCKPLRTLDLFPTKSTGALKDEFSTSKSSSCSASPTSN